MKAVKSAICRATHAGIQLSCCQIHVSKALLLTNFQHFVCYKQNGLVRVGIIKVKCLFKVLIERREVTLFQINLDFYMHEPI